MRVRGPIITLTVSAHGRGRLGPQLNDHHRRSNHVADHTADTQALVVNHIQMYIIYTN